MNKIYLIARIIIYALPALFSSQVFADRPVGINVSDVAHYNGQIVFKDIFKQAGAWATGYASGEWTYNYGWNIGGSVPLGANGYPLTLHRSRGFHFHHTVRK